MEEEGYLVDCVRRRVSASHEVGKANAQLQQLDLAMQLLMEKRGKADSDVVMLKEASVDTSRKRALRELRRDHVKKEYEVWAPLLRRHRFGCPLHC